MSLTTAFAHPSFDTGHRTLYKRVLAPRSKSTWRLHTIACPFALYRGEALLLPAGYVPPRHIACRTCLG